MSITNAVAARKPDPGRLTIRVDNGSQYASRDFRRSVDVLGARLEHIYANIPQQSGHMESFHKTLKKEYAWPHEFKDAEEAEVTLLEALDGYNRHREVIRYYFSSLPTLLFRPVSVRLPVLPATTVFDLPIRTRRR